MIHSECVTFMLQFPYHIFFIIYIFTYVTCIILSIATYICVDFEIKIYVYLLVRCIILYSGVNKAPPRGHVLIIKWALYLSEKILQFKLLI